MPSVLTQPSRFPIVKSTQSAESVARFDLPDAPPAFRSILWEAAFASQGAHALRRLALLSQNSGPRDDAASALPPAIEKKLKTLKRHLLDRLKGGRADIDWDDYDLEGTGDFHRRVWLAMRAIPFGETATYADVARIAGSPLAFRACGQACGANRILIFIPCHRVVASSGLGGFGCGLEWKKHFLAMEKAR